MVYNALSLTTAGLNRETKDLILFTSCLLLDIKALKPASYFVYSLFTLSFLVF